MKRYLIGIDVGTTGTKSMLFSDTGTVVAHAYRGYSLSNPNVGESEQDALDWWSAIVETVREITAGREISDKVAAISLSTQGGTFVPVDKAANPLRPAIVWNDNRFKEESEKFVREVGERATLYRKTGWKLGNWGPLLGIRYIKDKKPEIFAQSDKFLSVAGFVSLKMTGRAAVDYSNAGIDLLLDLNGKCYDKELLSFAGIREERLAELVGSGEVVGNLTKEAAAELGLSENTLLVSGALDQYAVALGAGSVNPGDILIGSGTCWVVTASGSEPDFDSGLAQSISAVSGLWGTLRSLSSGGVCLDWLRKEILAGESYAAIDLEVERVRAAEEGLFFYPFSGTHGGGSFTKASFVGMDLSHNRFHLSRAVMEGVVFQILWFMEGFKTKPRSEGLILAGGATKSRVWTQILADASGLPIRIPVISDLASVGAAILAGVGAKIYSSAEEGYKKIKIPEKVVLPRPEMTERYKPLISEYKKMAAGIGSAL